MTFHNFLIENPFREEATMKHTPFTRFLSLTLAIAVMASWFQPVSCGKMVADMKSTRSLIYAKLPQ